MNENEGHLKCHLDDKIWCMTLRKQQEDGPYYKLKY